MSKVSFSDATIRNLPLPGKGQRTYWDEKLSGFGLRVSQGGSKTFVVLNPRAKIRTAETIGRYGVVSVQEARTAARERLAVSTLAKGGLRPTKWQTAAAEYLQEIEQTKKPRTHKDYTRLLGRFKFDCLVSEVEPGDVDLKLKQLRKHPTEHYHAFSVLRSFLNWCHRKHYLDDHPMSRMKPPSPGKSRERVLTDEELGQVWRAAGDDTFGRIVKLLILTGMRRGEAVAISANMIGDGCINLPPEVTKNGRWLRFPITPEIEKLLVFPLSWSGFSKSKTALDKRAGVYGWTLHDLRRTFVSGLAALGTPVVVCEKLVNHVSGSLRGVAGIYNRYDFAPEMREAVEKWSAHVVEIARPRSSVTQMPRAERALSPV